MDAAATCLLQSTLCPNWLAFRLLVHFPFISPFLLPFHYINTLVSIWHLHNPRGNPNVAKRNLRFKESCHNTYPNLICSTAATLVRGWQKSGVSSTSKGKKRVVWTSYDVSASLKTTPFSQPLVEECLFWSFLGLHHYPLEFQGLWCLLLNATRNTAF